MAYRTYDAAWNRTGYADKPQYPGQANLTQDFPAKCPKCGSARIVGVTGLGTIVGVPSMDRAECANGHDFGMVAV